MNADSLHVVLDLDDVVLDFEGGAIEAVNRDFDADFDIRKKTGYDLDKYLNPIIGGDWWEWLENHAWLWGEKFKPVPGALGGIEKLRAAGHWIEIVTAKPEWAEDQVWVWFAKYKPRVHQVTFAPMQEISKADLSPEGDVLVDDKWENCLEWAATGRLAILFTRPGNTQYGRWESLPDHIVRANNWASVLRTIELEAEDVL